MFVVAYVVLHVCCCRCVVVDMLDRCCCVYARVYLLLSCVGVMCCLCWCIIVVYMMLYVYLC